jgi:hypothetical protein
MEKPKLPDNDTDAFVENALRRLDEESAQRRRAHLAWKLFQDDIRRMLYPERGSKTRRDADGLPSDSRADTPEQPRREVVTTRSRREKQPARDLVGGRCAKCRSSITFEIPSSTPPRSDWLCPVCAANEVKATYLSVALRLMFKRTALEETLAKHPQDSRDLKRVCKSVIDEMNELIEQLEAAGPS